jgi:hypothetical protein
MSHPNQRLPANVRRIIFLFDLCGVTYAARLVLFPSDCEMATYNHFLHKDWPVRGVFAKGYRFARVGAGRRLMGEVHVAREQVDLEVIVHAVYHLFDYLQRNGHAGETECARAAGQITLAMCRQLHDWGVDVPRVLGELTDVKRAEEPGAVLFVFRVGHEYSVRLLLPQEPETMAHVEALSSSASGSAVAEVKASQNATVDVVTEAAYHTVVALGRVERGASITERAKICGQLVAAICAELHNRGIQVLPARGAPTVLRLQDKWTPLMA